MSANNSNQVKVAYMSRPSILELVLSLHIADGVSDQDAEVPPCVG